MCVIYCGPASEVSDADFADMVDYSSNGVGIYGFDSGRYGRYLDPARALTVVRQEGDSEILLHLRLATSGHKGKAMLHPFRLPGGGFLAHNGIIGAFSYDPIRSDTAILAQDIWPLHGSDWLTDPILRLAFEAIVDGQRIAIVDVPGVSDRLTLFGEWYEHGAGIVSNRYWIPWTPPIKRPALMGVERFTDDTLTEYPQPDLSWREWLTYSDERSATVILCKCPCASWSDCVCDCDCQDEASLCRCLEED